MCEQYRNEAAVTACFTGDGASDEGSFHEALNLAGLWRLPVIFVCENNLYAGAQRQEEHTRIENIADRAAGYGMPGVVVDGNDAPAVYTTTLDARARAAAGDGPTLIECKTYRWRGHGESDPQHYQPKEEIAAWRARCPVVRMRDAVRALGLISAEELGAMETKVDALVREAIRFAEESPYPEPREALEDLYA